MPQCQFPKLFNFAHTGNFTGYRFPLWDFADFVIPVCTLVVGFLEDGAGVT
jgi:hypothetical protein